VVIPEDPPEVNYGSEEWWNDPRVKNLIKENGLLHDWVARADQWLPECGTACQCQGEADCELRRLHKEATRWTGARVKIIMANRWYSDRLGEEFEVLWDRDNKGWRCRDEGHPMMAFLPAVDCQVIGPGRP